MREHGLRTLGYGVALEFHRRRRMLARWVDAFITPAEFVRGTLARAGLDATRVHIIRLGVPTGGYVTAGPPLNEPSYVLYAGRLSDEKGVRVLIEAARLAPEVPVVVAGSGPLAGALRRRQLASVSLVGHVNEARLSVLHSGSCFSVLPSTCFDVSPYAALEAAAAGRAVVGSRIGGIPEIISDGENGLLVEPGNAQALASAMRRLWRDRPLAETLGGHAAARVREQHSLSQAAQDHLSLYEELVAA
jgi:glycosyltransferase involved in cell wall biosynthesis